MSDSLGRNVIDKYSGWLTDLIREDVQKNTLPFAICCQHWQGDFNLSSVLRSGNAFGAEAVFYLGGKKKYDNRGAVGVQHYSFIKFLPTIDDLKQLKAQYRFVGVENNLQRPIIDIRHYDFQPKTLLIFGEEGYGLTDEVLNLCDDLIYIQQRGSVRSLNVASAASIVMYDLTTKWTR